MTISQFPRPVPSETPAAATYVQVSRETLDLVAEFRAKAIKIAGAYSGSFTTDFMQDRARRLLAELADDLPKVRRSVG